MNSAEIAQSFSRSKKNQKRCKGVPPVTLKTKNQLILARRPIIHLYSLIFLK